MAVLDWTNTNTMKYNDLCVTVPRDKREVLNAKILMLIDTGELQGVTPEEMFNCYTGSGGLHGLDQEDFGNFHEYSEAKKEIEQGQFFTPLSLAAKIAGLIELKSSETIADLTCGVGVFANFFPEKQFYGCELDSKAARVAQFLFPATTIEQGDIRYYQPEIKFDHIVGNPPFNLKWKIGDKEMLSQAYYFEKAAAVLRPAGMLLAIVPQSFCADDFFNKSQIGQLSEGFNFICQVKLENNAFKNMGVTDFATKLLCLQRRSQYLNAVPYRNEFVDWEQAGVLIHAAIEIARSLKIKANSELSSNKEFSYKVRKYLYELHTQPALQPYYNKALAYVEKFRTQKCPDNMGLEEWHKKHRITEDKVLSYLKRTVKKQSQKKIDKIALVKDNYGIRYKAYSGKMQRELNEQYKTASWTFNDIVYYDLPMSSLPAGMPKGIRKLIERKKKAFARQQQSFNEVVGDASIVTNLEKFNWLSKDGLCHFNERQKGDLVRIFTKDYSVLNWQQGSGKTSAAYAWSKFRPLKKVFIVSNSLSINLTWEKFLTLNGCSYVNIKSAADLERIGDCKYVILSHDYLIKYQRQIAKAVKILSHKVCMVLDESDEITNHLAKRTRAIKRCFRKAKRKILTTGTTTRNNIAELYSQLELLYNNSINMTCECAYIYSENKDDDTLQQYANPDVHAPFPAYYGNTLFKSCFNPSKTTVFGIKQHNQNLYNEEHLRSIIERTIITRKFRDIAGDKYVISTESTYQTPVERHVYRTILNDFHTMVNKYFKSTGSSRKDSLLKIMRQLQLLIEATSTPQFFSEYQGSTMPNKAVAIFKGLQDIEGKACIGCTTIKATQWYYEHASILFPFRQIFLIKGDVSFKSRQKIIDAFEATANGILICTQQSLKSSVNIPSCDDVFIESLQWNIPKMEQFFFRFIRYDSKNLTRVRFITYENTIEANLLALLMAKEKLNDYIKTLEYRDNSDIYGEYGIDTNILSSLITKEWDEEGKVQLRWGQAEAA